jgi:hypothetical protein
MVAVVAQVAHVAARDHGELLAEQAILDLLVVEPPASPEARLAQTATRWRPALVRIGSEIWPAFSFSAASRKAGRGP